MKILIVEDNHHHFTMLVRQLEEERQEEAKFRNADRLAGAYNYLERGDITCVILDLNLPDSSGINTYLTLRSKYPYVPIVVITNDKHPDLMSQLAEVGATHFVIKDFRDPLPLWSHVQEAIEESAVKG